MQKKRSVMVSAAPLLTSTARRRNPGWMLIALGAGLGFLLLLTKSMAAQQPVGAVGQTRYSVTDLGTLGGTFSVGGGINNKGWVVGTGTLPGDTQLHDFLWQGGVKIDLGTLGGPNSGEVTFGGPSESGQVVGEAETSTPDPNGEDFCGFGTHLICLPFLWQDEVMTPLPTLGGNNGTALDINDRGQAVGFAENTTLDPTCPTRQLQSKPALWENGEIHELPTFPGDLHGQALSINDEGQAVGGSGTCFIGSITSFFHALLWQNGTLTDLGNLGGTHSNDAVHINNRGQVVGVSDLPGDTIAHAFRWQNGVIRDLGALPGDFFALASSNNDEGQVVGFSFSATDFRAFLWQNGVMVDLNTLIPPDSPLFPFLANDISDRGEIVGLAFLPSTGEVHGFLATPIQSTETGNPAAGSAIAPSPHVTLPERVRKQLLKELGLGKIGR